MKPMGMNSSFQIVVPSRAQDKVFDAVEEALSENWTVDRFINEARECWGLKLDEMAKAADQTFAKAVAR